MDLKGDSIYKYDKNKTFNNKLKV